MVLLERAFFLSISQGQYLHKSVGLVAEILRSNGTWLSYFVVSWRFCHSLHSPPICIIHGHEDRTSTSIGCGCRPARCEEDAPTRSNDIQTTSKRHPNDIQTTFKRHPNDIQTTSLTRWCAERLAWLSKGCLV